MEFLHRLISRLGNPWAIAPLNWIADRPLPPPVPTHPIREQGWRIMAMLLGVLMGIMAIASPAQASNLDPYVMRFLDVNTPVNLPMDQEGQVQAFSGADLSIGKRLFEDNCLTCHVGGTTLPNPLVPLSLAALGGATPPRTSVTALAAFIRRPMTYDGSEDELFCRQVPPSWMSDAEVEKLAAFILRAAQKAPAWGTQEF